MVADYLKTLPLGNAAIAAIFLSGRPFPVIRRSHCSSRRVAALARHRRTIGQIRSRTQPDLSQAWRRRIRGAGGTSRKARIGSLTQRSAAGFFEIATARARRPRPSAYQPVLKGQLRSEAKYIVKIISGDLRIGLKESLVEEAIARAFDVALDQVKRANMLLGDLGETLRAGVRLEDLAEAHMRLFHPIDFMLASPVESTEEALSYFPRRGASKTNMMAFARRRISAEGK